jgi:hypothetical protein
MRAAVGCSPGRGPQRDRSRFDQNALQLLQTAQGGQIVIALSGPSRISRNSCKLLRVVEFFLSCQATILTTNYLLTCKEVSVRQRELVKARLGAPHRRPQSTSGLTGSHRKTIEARARQVSPPAQ